MKESLSNENMEERLQKVEQELYAIRERNARVEADKAWETSLFRMLSLGVITYLVAAALLYLIDVSHFLFAALVPAVGFMLSVQSLPFLKRWRIDRRHTLTSHFLVL